MTSTTITLLDGLPSGAAGETVADVLRADGSPHRLHRLHDEVFAPCQGCWECWVASPGQCKANDAANGVMRDIMVSDAILWTTEIRYGCWAPVAKAALDRSIGLISPFFTRRDGETHHRKRYDHYPRWAVLAVVDASTTEDERTRFATLVARNTLNMHGALPWVGFVDAGADEVTFRKRTREALAALAAPAEEGAAPKLTARPQRPSRVVPPKAEGAPRHVVLWVGSAKPKGTSTSESLGGYLVDALVARGWTSEAVHVAHTVRIGRDQSPKLVEAVRRADLVVAATPLYVDALPALVLQGLRNLELAAKAEPGPMPAILPIVQCGFPEAGHNALAVDILADAAGRIGMPWVGHLAMGGGGIIDGMPLKERGGVVHHQAAALDAVAARLDEGGTVDEAMGQEFATPAIPGAAYRAIGQVGWVALALKHGSLLKLWDRPMEERTPT
ncbi:MAG: flavodoxin family protein [Myxococcales bacterium]|nr:flavodoxin family protein [Myxococcales bacterium]